MSDPAEIYLQPECCADPAVGRVWCEHNAPQDCDDGKQWTRYVLAARLAEAEALLHEAQSQLRDQPRGSTLDDRIDAFLAADSADVADPEATVHKEVGVSRPAKSVKTPADQPCAVHTGGCDGRHEIHGPQPTADEAGEVAK